MCSTTTLHGVVRLIAKGSADSGNSMAEYHSNLLVALPHPPVPTALCQLACMSVACHSWEACQLPSESLGNVHPYICLAEVIHPAGNSVLQTSTCRMQISGGVATLRKLSSALQDACCPLRHATAQPLAGLGFGFATLTTIDESRERTTRALWPIPVATAARCGERLEMA